MEKFSHDLTRALEETSKVRAGHCWGVRRRTRSTGNLPCAPQPTEDSSSSPGEGANEGNDGLTNSILSDSDDRQDYKLALRTRQPCLFGNFESDSLNENFSPTRPNTRRKRKFKRMAVEYETTPSTPGNSNPSTIFPVATNCAVKKRVMKHTSQENFRASIFFCGKRKRSHRDRYYDHDSRFHSSSVPRQRDLFVSKGSYFEYRTRNRNSHSKQCERILPLNKSIISKIEKISQESSVVRPSHKGFPFNSSCLAERNFHTDTSEIRIPGNVFKPQVQPAIDIVNRVEPSPTISRLTAQKSGSFESTFDSYECNGITHTNNRSNVDSPVALASISSINISDYLANQRKTKSKQTKRQHLKKLQLQFEDTNGMDCVGINDFLSSSSLSSSDSEAAATNESDREGDDELTDWPGNEAMVNFASKNDFKRAKQPRGASKITTTTKSGGEEFMGQDDDTLMSAEETFPTLTSANTAATIVPINIPQTIGSGSTMPPNTLNLSVRCVPNLANDIPKISSLPIDIVSAGAAGYDGFIESEMSGETSNHFSSPCVEVREFRAGCRRVRDERPGFTIFTSVNEHLSRFLQDSRQTQLTLPYTDSDEHVKLLELAKLYSLTMHIENGRAVLSKTIKTTQTVKIGQSNISTRFLGDYKRRCYGNDDDSESTEMAS